MKNLERAFLGTGWSFPPTFSRAGGGVEMVSEERDIRESLWVLFCTALGERVMVPEYGTALWQLVFQNVTTSLMTQIEDAVRQAILYWEPRIDVDAVTVEPDASVAGLVLVTVEYTVRSTNARSNLVYPFYLQEGTLPAQGP
jgi:phage baseplate assembly protein W